MDKLTQAREATHRHKKCGTKYVLMGIGRMQADWEERVHSARPRDGENSHQSVDMREVAIYRSVTDPAEIWVRPREDFEDGRFEALPTAGQKQVNPPHMEYNDNAVASRRWDTTYPGGQWLYFTGPNQDGQKLFIRPDRVTITDEMIDAVTDELLAHGEFSSIPGNNAPNARIAAQAVLTVALNCKK